jgi:hypothetical protein
MVAYMSESQPCRRWHAKEAFGLAWAVSLNLTKLAVLNWWFLEAAKFGCGAPPADESRHSTRLGGSYQALDGVTRQGTWEETPMLLMQEVANSLTRAARQILLDGD